MPPTNPTIPEPKRAVVKSSVPLPKLQRTNAFTGVQFATILYYGLARMGKTHILRSLTGMRVLVLATESGKTKGLGTLAKQDFFCIPINSHEEMQAVIVELLRVPGKCQYQGEEFDVVVIDSLSMLGDLWMDKALSILGWDEIGIAQTGKDTRTPYMYVAEKGRSVTKRLLDNIAAHVVCVCREGTLTETADDGTKEYVPAPEFPGQQLAREIPGLLDASLRMRKINGSAVFCTRTEYKAVSGIRIDLGVEIPKYIKPDLAALIRLMKGDVTAIEDLKIPKKAA